MDTKSFLKLRLTEKEYEIGVRYSTRVLIMRSGIISNVITKRNHGKTSFGGERVL